ncbi:MAG TPA: AI-2E family transporter [Bellilinea sp.]|nr:AI-2E family transporter [Bellilinea sp.]
MSNPSNDEIISRVNRSPRWSSTTKLVVGLTLVAVSAAMIIRFKELIGPIVFAIALAYLLYPLASFLHTRLRVSWKLASVLMFVIVLVALLGTATLSGIAVVDQVSSLVKFLQVQIENLPTYIDNLTKTPINLGFYTLDFSTLDLPSIVDQLLGAVQPLLTNLGNLVTSFATGAATTVGYVFFTVLVAYFILSESGGVRGQLINLDVPGYTDDLARMRTELSRIWNAFLRGQLIIVTITVLIYTPILGALHVNYYFGLALLAGFARFVPYVGTWVAWITYALVTYFQGYTIFGLEPIFYSILILGIAMVLDFFLDNFVVPSLMGNALNIHPAAVMVAALVFAGLFGLVGVLLAAPVMATLKLVLNYVFKKLLDQDPWDNLETESTREPSRLAKDLSNRIKRMLKWFDAKVKRRWPEDPALIRWIKGAAFYITRGKTGNPWKSGETK